MCDLYFFFLIYKFFTSCSRSLLCPHLAVAHPAAFPELFRSTAEHDLLLTLDSTAWESGRCSWVSSSHKHLGWCSGLRTSPVYLTQAGLEELEADWELRNWGWSQKNQNHQGKAVSSFNPACTTQPVNSHLKACQNCPDKTDFVLSVCFLPSVIISGAESLLTALVSITWWFNTSSTFSCWMQFELRAAGMEKVKAVEDTILCSLSHFYKTLKSQLVGRGGGNIHINMSLG